MLREQASKRPGIAVPNLLHHVGHLRIRGLQEALGRIDPGFLQELEGRLTRLLTEPPQHRSGADMESS